MLTAFNKLDRLPVETEDDEPKPWAFLQTPPDLNDDGMEVEEFGISALTGTGLIPLLQAIGRRLEREREMVCVELPLSAGKTLAWLRRNGKVLEEAYSETAVSVTALISSKIAGQLRKQLAVGAVE